MGLVFVSPARDNPPSTQFVCAVHKKDYRLPGRHLDTTDGLLQTGPRALFGIPCDEFRPWQSSSLVDILLPFFVQLFFCPRR